MLTSQEAETIVGKQPDGVYTLDLADHPGRYEKDAPPLATLLRTTKVEAILEEYTESDREAVAAQTQYKGTMQRANVAILVAAALGASMMAVQIVFGGLSFTRYVILALGVFSALSGALAAMWLFRVRGGAMLADWMGKRAIAETQRLSYFAMLGVPSAGEPADVELDLLRLEYFRRYQLDLQEIYYHVRGERHRKDANETLGVGSYAVVLSALASLATGAAGAAVSGIATALGALGVFAAATSSFANAREAMSQDRRNAERYARTRSALRGLRGRLDEVREAVSKGNRQALAEFVVAVNDQISLEHRQWLEATEATKEVTARLDAALAATQHRADQPTGTGVPGKPVETIAKDTGKA
jgi:hypothetical protein